MKCYFHSSDLDGHCSGAIVKHFNPECEMIGVQYGDEPDWPNIAQGEEIHIVDFSFPMDILERLCNELHCIVVWIDHHKTAIEAYNSYDKAFSCAQVILSSTRAACELAWAYYAIEVDMPQAVHLLGRYDVYEHNYDKLMEFQYGMRIENTHPENQDLWSRLFKGVPFLLDQIANGGRSLIIYTEKLFAGYADAAAFEVDFEGFKCIACNVIPFGFGSALFKSVWNPKVHDVMLLFCWTGKQWVVSMYTDQKPGIDVSVIAEKYDGGGHPGAAGFRCNILPFAPGFTRTLI